jgi:hypothetical protein
MSIHSLASAQLGRRRASQRQQQPDRLSLNRQQQQQGSSEYQHGQTGPSAASPARRSASVQGSSQVSGADA